MVNPLAYRRWVGSPPATSATSATPLLLDTYTGAVAAYSLRKLRTAYEGDCIRVRESDGDTETDIGFSGNALDTAALLAHCGVNDGFTPTWYNQGTSGSTFDLSQSTASFQPQVVSSGSVVVDGNGNPQLDAQNGYDMATTGDPALVTQPFTVILVGSGSSVSATAARETTGDVVLTRPEADDSRMYAGAYISASTDVGSDFFVMSCLFNGASSVLRVDGTSVGGSSDAGTNDQVGLLLDSRGIRWSEVIYFDADKSSEIAAIESNIMTYYGVS